MQISFVKTLNYELPGRGGGAGGWSISSDCSGNAAENGDSVRLKVRCLGFPFHT